MYVLQPEWRSVARARPLVQNMNAIVSRAVWAAAAVLCVLTYAAMLCGCEDGSGIRAMSDRWCAEHNYPRPQCAPPLPPGVRT